MPRSSLLPSGPVEAAGPFQALGTEPARSGRPAVHPFSNSAVALLLRAARPSTKERTVPDDDFVLDDADLEETEHDTDLVKHLRRQLKGAKKRTSDYDALREQIDSLTKANRGLAMTGLLSEAGLGDLDDAQRETLAEWAGKQEQVDADSLRARAVALKWADPPEDPADREIEAQERNSAAQRGQGRSGTEITAVEFAGWDQARKRAFMTAHRDLFDALKRGEAVRRPAA